MAVEMYWQTDVDGATLDDVEGQAVEAWRAFMGDRLETVPGAWILVLDVSPSVATQDGTGAKRTVSYGGTASVRVVGLS